MRLPNLLATRRGRLAAFFPLYITEGIPLGFAATAVATQMRRQGVGPAEIGAFVGSFYLPWAFKWAAGPFVDMFSLRPLRPAARLDPAHAAADGARRCCAVAVPLPAGSGLFTVILLVHNASARLRTWPSTRWRSTR